MRLLLAIAVLLVPGALPAAAPREMIEIRAGQPVTIRPDRGYILFRTVRPDGVPSVEPAFMRVPTTEEIERYRTARREAFERAAPDLIRRYERQLQREPNRAGPRPSLENFAFLTDAPANLQNIEYGRPLVRGQPESVFLVEVLPGDYVLYGASYGSGALRPGLHACFCLGTVGFPVRAGVITDLGQFFGDMVHRVSSIPELRAESGFGPSSNGFLAPLGATVRPAQPGSAVPEILRTATVVSAEYRAVGKFFDPRATTINRLVAVPGVLDYDGGRVIDVRTGQEAQGGHY